MELLISVMGVDAYIGAASGIWRRLDTVMIQSFRPLLLRTGLSCQVVSSSCRFLILGDSPV